MSYPPACLSLDRDLTLPGHHNGHHQRRDQHHDRTDIGDQQKHKTEGGKAAIVEEGQHEGTMGVGMRMGEKVADHTKGGMPMRKE